MTLQRNVVSPVTSPVVVYIKDVLLDVCLDVGRYPFPFTINIVVDRHLRELDLLRSPSSGSLGRECCVADVRVGSIEAT